MDTINRRPSLAALLLHGLPGHPLHPPLTDATIGMFVLATGLAVSLAGLVALTAGGWLGGALVFVHGVRVLGAEEPSAEQPRRAAVDGPTAYTPTTTTRR